MEDEKLISAVYERNVRKIYRFFYLKTLLKQTAEDLTSESFLRFTDIFLAGKDSIENRDNLDGFLFGIAKNVFLEYLRQKYRSEICLENIDDFSNYVEKYSQATSTIPQLKKTLLTLLPQLPQKQSKIIGLRIIEGLSLQQVALKLNKSTRYILTTQNRAINSLKKLLANITVFN
jgi:RNA polymerase sigma-70 factor (ECF subfamily)